jgi:predicted nucleic acid-binding protein
VSVFIDTSALYALLSTDDPNHEPAHQTLRAVVDREVLITHNYIAVEAVSLVYARYGRAQVGPLRRLLDLAEVVWVEDHEHHAALDQLMVGRTKRGPSFVDLVSFDVMRRLDVPTAFAYDGDFVAQGFSMASPSES